MRFLSLIGLLGLLGWGAATPPGQNLLQQTGLPPQATDVSRHAPPLGPYGQLPLSFEANQGQTDGQVQFLARGQGYTLFLTAGEAVFAFRPRAAHRQRHRGLMPRTGAGQDPPDAARAVVRMQLLGANPAPQVVGLEELPGKAHYFIGNDPHQWRTNVPTYARVQYANVYPGVDLVYYGNQGQLEYDLVVQPGADPSRIALDIEASLVSARGLPARAPLRVSENGELVVGTEGSEVVFRQPVVYQPATDSGLQTRDIVEGKYVIRAGQQVTFDIASYDKTRPLVIDPTLVYSSYLGGSGEDFGTGITVDTSGHAYLTGATESADFPTTAGAFQTTKPGFRTAIVTKLNATGSAVLYSTYLGGSEEVAGGRAIAVDAAGHAYVVGDTNSADFPTTPGAFQTAKGGARGVNDAFVTKLNPTGSALVYSTFLGTSVTVGNAIAVDASGHAYVAGFTNSADFPTTPGAFSESGNGFITKLNTAGSALVYSTRLAGADVCSGLAVDAAGHAYVTGQTSAPDFPTTPGAFQTTLHSSGGNAFVAKLTPDGTALVYATYLGGSGTVVVGPGGRQRTTGDAGLGIAIDAAGHAYVTGNTSSADFPITSDAFQTTFGGGPQGSGDAFVTKLNATGSALVYSSYLGGSDIDNGTGIGVDAAANAYATGYSFSSNFPTVSGAFQTMFGGGVDAFVARIAVLTFAGTPGRPNCFGESVSALARQYGGLDDAAEALGFPSVQALQDAIREFCEE
jgi:hypothetical protein